MNRATLWLMACLLMPTLGCGDSSGGITLGNEASVDVVPPVLAFSDVPRGQLARLNITVRHIGSGGVIKLSPIRLETTSLDLALGEIEKETLAPGEEVRIPIVYNSANDEPDLATLIIGHNLSGNPETRIPISTPGQRGRLVAAPQLLDFGIVQAAAPATINLRVINGGTAPATLTDYLAEGDDLVDFKASIPSNATIAPDSELVVPVTYTPTGRNDDQVTITFKTERPDVDLVVEAYGEEETPVLIVTPSLVQLGWSVPGEVAVREVVVTNDGNTNLDVDSVTLEDAPSVLALTNRPTGPFILRPGQSHTMGVVFSPISEVPITSEPLAKIRFISSDAARNPFVVPIYGAAGTPSILVIPESIVDFAFVAQGFTAKRSVVVINQGGSAVSLTSAKLVDPSSEEFVLANASELPKVLNAGESFELMLTFENRRGADGTEFSRLFLTTTDPVVPEYPLDVVARRAQRPTCEAAFVPDLLALGAHSPGQTGTGRLTIQNTGSGNCEYRERDFDACLGSPFGISFQFICDDQIAFNPFRITSEPAARTILGPGSTLDFDVSFKAPELRGDLGRDSYYARLAAVLFDPNASALRFVTPPGGVGRGVNVRAETAVPIVSIDPRNLDFGLVRTDCASDLKQVRVRADGPIDATVTAVTPIGCGANVRVTGPALPALVPAFGAIFYRVVFAPDQPVPTTCTLRIENNSYNNPSVDVAIEGGGTDVTHQVDTYTQVPAPKVDVLFVVDDSSSMGDDQERLRQELPKVIEVATRWGQDFHIGITTTDTLQVKGGFVGIPRYAETGANVSLFAENLLVGTGGFYIEAGLETAYLALYNRSVVTSTVCNPEIPGQCPRDDGSGVPLICIDPDLNDGVNSGFCSGRNAGFLRDDAELVVIIVSDEEDSSPNPTAFYIDRFSDLKGLGSGVGVVVHSVIVPSSGCLAGFGTPGLRYSQVSEALNGAIVSICAPDFGAEFETVANRTFGLKDRFYPTLEPIASTIEVRVAGQACTQGWTWNPSTHAVIFDANSPCFPEFDQSVEIEYDVYCATAD